MRIAANGGAIEVKTGTNGIYFGLHDGTTGTALVLDEDAALAVITHLSTAVRLRRRGETMP